MDVWVMEFGVSDSKVELVSIFGGGFGILGELGMKGDVFFFFFFF